MLAHHLQESPRAGRGFLCLVWRTDNALAKRVLAASSRLLAAAALLLPVAPAAAQVPTDPLLRIEAGMHTAVIYSIDTDASGRYALTASVDKTARVWDVATGRLLQVLRPPIGPGYEGKLYAAAISPDGSAVAAAGWTTDGTKAAADSHASSGPGTIYLFDRATGLILRRFSGLPEAVFDLSFSADGRWLAATLGGSHGVRIWDWRNVSSPPWSDTAYGDTSASVHWGRDGRFVTTSFDGRLRVYAAPSGAGGALRPLVEVAVPSDDLPRKAAFSPDGSRIAVAYMNNTHVDVLDSRTLHALHSPQPSDLGYGNLAAIAWSADGRTLAAAGVWALKNGNHPVRLWPDGGRGEMQEVPTVGSTVTDLKALPGGGWLLASADADWGVLTAEGRWQPRGNRSTADLRGSYGTAHLWLRNGGTEVQFGLADAPEPPYVFSIGRRTLRSGRLDEGEAADTDSSPVQDWQENPHPLLNGKALELEPMEFSHSLAMSPGGASFVLGTAWRLIHFNVDGSKRWSRPAPSVTWGVNIPRTGTLAGKLVVAAYGDGTIRWHRMTDGAELLAFFPHADHRRWVLWTPGGYYDASPGAEDLIGWHVNRGQDQAADFFPASRFRSRFYRPDVIDRVLDTLDEAEALKQADQAASRRPEAPASVAQVLPPVVDLLSSAELHTNSAQVTLRVRGRTAPNAPVTAWRVRVNGELAPELRGLGRQDAGGGGDMRELQVSVPARDSEISIFAENRHGVSTPATVRVTWAGAALSTEVVKPRLYVLAIGVGQYRHREVQNLGALPAKDANDFVAAIQRQQGRLYESVEVKLLTDAEATRDNVVDALEWLQRRPRQFDVSMLFVSGHGVNDPAMGYLFLPVNADPDALKRTAVNWADFKTTVVAMVGKRIVFMDTCHSGNALGTSFKAPYTDIGGVISDLASTENGVVVFASSTGRQFSIQDPAWGNGAFTKSLVEGLNGAADGNARNEITHKRLSVYVSDRVRDLTRGRQSPVNLDPVGVPDFPVAVK